MIFLQRPSLKTIHYYWEKQKSLDFSYHPQVGASHFNSLKSQQELASSYQIDHHQISLGHGEATFLRAKKLMREKKFFPLWEEVFPVDSTLESGDTLAILIPAFKVWTLAFARVVYRIDESRRFGFAYGTLAEHPERGEERFCVEWSEESDEVFYSVFAFSKPQQFLTRLAKPWVRKLQKKFAQDSLNRMKEEMSYR